MMKKIVQISIMLTALIALNSKLFSQEITFINLTNNLGSIEKNGNGSGTFKFVNTGLKTLIITNVKSSCGCLVPMWLRKPVEPGDTAIVGFRYDTKRIGPINKSMTVNSNAVTQPTVVVRIKGNVYEQFTQLTQHEFDIDLGRLDFNEIRRITLPLVSQDSSTTIHIYGRNKNLLSNSPYLEMLKYDLTTIKDWHKEMELTFTNIWGNEGKISHTFYLDYNNKIPIQINVTANYTGYPGNKTFLFRDTISYTFENKIYTFKDDKLKSIETKIKRKYNKEVEFRTSEILLFENGLCVSRETRRYYNKKIYLSFWEYNQQSGYTLKYREERDDL